MQRAVPSSEALLELLVGEGLISRTVADTLAVRVRDGWIPLGKILRQQGALTMGQLMDLLQEQANSPGERLGGLALRLGMCTPADIERALRTQAEASPHLIELLLRGNHCEPERLCRVLARYVRLLEERLDTIQPAS